MKKWYFCFLFFFISWISWCSADLPQWNETNSLTHQYHYRGNRGPLGWYWYHPILVFGGTRPHHSCRHCSFQLWAVGWAQSSVKELEVKPLLLCIGGNQLIWLVDLIREAPPWIPAEIFTGHVQLEGFPCSRPRAHWRIIHPIWPRNALGIPYEELEEV